MSQGVLLSSFICSPIYVSSCVMKFPPHFATVQYKMHSCVVIFQLFVCPLYHANQYSSVWPSLFIPCPAIFQFTFKEPEDM